MSTPSFAAARIMASRFGMLICRLGWISSTTRRRYAAASQSPYTSAGPLGSIFSGSIGQIATDPPAGSASHLAVDCSVMFPSLSQIGRAHV